MIRVKQKHAGQFAVSSGSRLEGGRVHAGDFDQEIFKIIHELQDTLAKIRVKHGVCGGKTGLGRLALIGFGVIFHGAGAQRVHAAVNREVPLRQARVMANNIDFAQIGEIRTVSNQVFISRKRRYVSQRHGKAASAFLPFFP